MKYFFWYFLNTTVNSRFINSSIGTANEIQKKNVYVPKMGKQIESSISVKTLLQ